jgi:DNA polymerase-3 subunit delta
VYLFHGEDEYAIAQDVSKIEAHLGDASIAAMNTTRLDGRSYNPDDLLSVASAMPFLTDHRLVILTYPLARLNSDPARKKFLAQLDQVPRTTKLVLIEYRVLTERKGGVIKKHWLEKWADGAGDRAFQKAFPLPKGKAMAGRIQELAKAAGGQITPDAADLLAALVGDEPRLASQEIQKLLAYVNYRRAIEAEDVDQLTADTAQGDIFNMVDSLGNRDGKQAIGMLYRLLEQQDPFSIFGMIVRQFRLLLLAREVMERGGNVGAVAQELGIKPFVAEKVYGQARQFSIPVLEAVYHRLLELDEAMKTSMIDGDLALGTLAADFTSRPGQNSTSR